MSDSATTVPAPASAPAGPTRPPASAPVEPVAVTPSRPGLAATLAANGWTFWHGLALLALMAAGIYLTRDGWADLLFLAWNDPESSHILLVPVAAGWLFWLLRHRLAEVRPGFSLIGLAFIGLGWASWEWGYYESVRVAGHIAAVALLLGTLLSVAGSRLFWKLLPVFGVFLFAIPVPYRIRMPISIPLQRYTAQITENIMNTLGIEVTRAGSVLTINGVDVGVAEACNGMRMVFAIFMVTYLFAFMNHLKPSTRVLLLLAAPAIALACNLVRLVPTVFLYGYASDDVAETFHDLSGWAVIALAFLAMIGTLNLMYWMLAVDESTPDVPAVAPTGGR